MSIFQDLVDRIQEHQFLLLLFLVVLLYYLKNILIKYYPGAGTNMLNSVLFDIFATEEDLASHTRVEDYLFVPAILALEKQL